MRYPIELTPDGRFLMVTSPDIPELASQGEGEADALVMASDALRVALGTYFKRNLPVPPPSRVKRGQPFVELPASLAAKALLHNEMLRQRVRPSELARRLNVTKPEVTRLLDPLHTTKIDMIAAAASALNRELVVALA
jgi:antitoxin HicB